MHTENHIHCLKTVEDINTETRAESLHDQPAAGQT